MTRTAESGRSTNVRRWRELRARAIRQEIRAHGAVYCRSCGKGPLDPEAPPGSAYAIDADHVEPVALGGAALPSVAGIRLTCPPCNRGEGRAISEEKARRTRQATTPRGSAFGFVDESSRWNPATREW